MVMFKILLLRQFLKQFCMSKRKLAVKQDFMKNSLLSLLKIFPAAGKFLYFFIY